MLNWTLFCLYFACGLASISVSDKHAREVARIEQKEQERVAQWLASGRGGVIFTSNYNSYTNMLARIGVALYVVASVIAIYMLYGAWQNQSAVGRAVVVGIGVVIVFGRFRVRYARTVVTIYLALNLVFAVYLVFADVL